MPARVLLQDFTGVPCVVDLAAMRDAHRRAGGEPRSGQSAAARSELVIDHSVQGGLTSAPPMRSQLNAELEYHRNRERYALSCAGARAAFNNFQRRPARRPASCTR